MLNEKSVISSGEVRPQGELFSEIDTLYKKIENLQKLSEMFSPVINLNDALAPKEQPKQESPKCMLSGRIREMSDMVQNTIDYLSNNQL